MNTPHGHDVLLKLLATGSCKCPGCRKAIDRAVGWECPFCGEVLALEVKSKRQFRMSDKGAIPVWLAIALSTYQAGRCAFVAAMIWVASWSILRQGGLAAAPQGLVRMLAGVSVPALMMLALAWVLWWIRRPLLRARARARWLALVVSVLVTGLAHLLTWMAVHK